MSAEQTILSAWTWEPTVIVGCALLLAVYFWATRRTPGKAGGKQAAAFTVAVVLLLLSLVSPIDTLGDEYLFSVHMIQHLMMTLVVAPLLLLGTPEWLMLKVLQFRPAGALSRWLGAPLVAWAIGVVVIWVWHLPALYNAALADEGVHAFQHITFLVSATIMWWPILSPVKESRINPLAGVAYLAAAAMSSTLLGIILTFAQPGLYPAYLHPNDELGILGYLRGSLGLSAAIDQQVGGLIMWVPGSLVYLISMMITLGRWYSEPEDDEYEQPDRVPAQPAQDKPRIEGQAAKANSLPTEGV